MLPAGSLCYYFFVQSAGTDHRVTQEAIREVVSVIRRWYLTICHDLCIHPPRIRIRKPTVVSLYNLAPGGQYESLGNRVTIYVVGERMQEEYIMTLAHELRHAWQHQYQVPPTERDAENYMRDCISRFKNGPEAGEYTGPIEGLSVVMRCRRCGAKFEAGIHTTCPTCISQRRNVDSDKRALRDGSKLPPPVPPTDTRSAGDRLKQAFQRWQREKHQRAVAQSFQYRRDNIDNHPSNGRTGWWRVEQAYYVHASSAGEAIIKVAGHPVSDCPSIEYLGEEIPPELRQQFSESKNR